MGCGPHRNRPRAGRSQSVGQENHHRWELRQELEYGVTDWYTAALFLGPVISYRHETWWAAFTVMPQIYGWNNSRSQDGNSHLELNDHEKLNIRLLFGFNF